MSCALGMIRWIIFLVNFIFALGGLALFGVGLYLTLNLPNAEQLPEMQIISPPTILLIAVGGIIFLIAFFGCCGAVQESHCMIVTFALMLLTLLVVQVAAASYAYYKMKDGDLEANINAKLKTLVDQYGSENQVKKSTVDAMQIFGDCCGYTGKEDYTRTGSGQIPFSCCNKPESSQTCSPDEVVVGGCKDRVFEKLKMYGHGLGLGALIIAAVELVGVVFSFCLANSIRNADRRGYKV